MSPHKLKKLSLFGACGVAVAGMIGGGIFAVLGEVVVVAGNAGFISLGLGGVLALITGIVYSKLTVKFDEQGGSFTFLEHYSGPQLAGTASWFLMLGYVYTISLYAYIFSAYAERLLGLGYGPNFYLGSGIVIIIILINFIPFKKPGLSATLVIIFKACILAGLIVIGYISFDPYKIYPIIGKGSHNIILGAALVFVAYEGFQHLTYDYNKLSHHKKNLPKAVKYSILIVICLYMLIAFAITGNLSIGTITQNKETALALLAYPLLGQPGVILTMTAAVFSTASAIFATIFATGHLAERVAKDGQLPPEMTRWHSGNRPVIFFVLIGVLSIALQRFNNLHQLTVTASLIFLLIFALVNYIGYQYRVYHNWKKIFPLIGSMGCAGGAGYLLYDTYATSPAMLLQLLGIFLVLFGIRFSYTWFHTHYARKKKRG